MLCLFCSDKVSMCQYSEWGIVQLVLGRYSDVRQRIM